MLKKALYLLSCISLVSASPTMCYKKEHQDPSTIESTPLNGGECKGKLSVDDMKKNGYEVDSMKIQNGEDALNYIYVFKKTKNQTSKTDLKKQLQLLDDEKKLQTKTEATKASIEAGKKLYNSKCISCHKDGTISAYNSARPLVDLSVDDIKESIRDYSLDEKDNGMAILMKPYANLLGDKDIINVANYIQTLK
ncbi:MAG: c-type cytochrome [Campylobacterota bacterium]|nr:c-type cytochrome [Campylobacterota bacterium]